LLDAFLKGFGFTTHQQIVEFTIIKTCKSGSCASGGTSSAAYAKPDGRFLFLNKPIKAVIVVIIVNLTIF
jgi:hypothetical protein